MMSTQDNQATPHDDHHQEGHGSTSLYISVFIALCCLTSLSFLTYFEFWRAAVPLGVSRVFMMGVSCTKAMLVITFFMHLKWEANWKWVLTIPASMMAIFLMLMLVPDIGLRMRHASNVRMTYAAEVETAPLTGDHDAGSLDTGNNEKPADVAHDSDEATEHPSK